ncbi:MAG TPA: hypothetical protein VIP70_11505 [Nitrososphaeraceae archaeon]
MKKNNNESNRKDAQVPQADDEDLKKTLKETLVRSIQMLKLDHHNNNNQITEKAFQFIQKFTSKQIKTYGNWILALNTIADSCLAVKQILSQSEVYDFLTVAVATNIEDENRRRTKAIDNTIFWVYRDIMTNYQLSDDKLKIAYPKIIVDVIAILAKGLDTEGKKVAKYNIESYYQIRKLNISTASASTTIKAAATAASIATIQKEKEKKEKDEIPSSTLLKPKGSSKPSRNEQYHHISAEEEKQEIIDNLNQITGRSKKLLEISFAEVQPTDIRRLRDLCANYNKLQKYCDLVHSSEEKFKLEIQKELGRKLTDYQLQHATNSIRKARQYIENLLDGKFVPHGSYGINHVKHNLEYGYQLIGIMQPSRRKGVKETSKK